MKDTSKASHVVNQPLLARFIALVRIFMIRYTKRYVEMTKIAVMPVYWMGYVSKDVTEMERLNAK